MRSGVVGVIVGMLGLWVTAVDAERIDPLMGDWQGVYETTYGDRGQFVSQIIALGGGKYRITNLDRFDTRAEPINVLNAELKDGKVTFVSPDGWWKGRGVVQGDVFRGKFEGDESGDFEMRHVVRLSPTLGARPPKGAIVLFDGKDLKKWERIGGFAGLIDLAHHIGGDNAAAYLQSSIASEQNQPAVIELGSDDGVKVWLNEKVVHVNDASRGVTPGQDKVKVSLKKGWNRLMLKVTNGQGGWGACVRIVGPDGKPLKNIREMVSIESGSTGTRKNLDANAGFLTTWWVTGPYRKQGVQGNDLLDIVMGPELRGKEPDWKKVSPRADPKDPRWMVKDGMMQVRDGSIATKRKFTDFRMHIEFKTPFMPTARGQARGNSGVYLQGRYEVQVLDSYGLEGADNECGGIYQMGRPVVNMCAPPMQWQTYDIEFRAARFDAEGHKTTPATLTMKHNGVIIHYLRPLSGPTGGALDGNERQPGGIMLQDHGNLVQYRNIWLVETPGAESK